MTEVELAEDERYEDPEDEAREVERHQGHDADEPATAAAVAETVRTDGRPLRTLIYAAGIGSTKRSVVDTALDEFEQLWQANAMGFVAIWQATADLARADGASVVVISSEATRTAGGGNGPYSASKAALETIAAVRALEEGVAPPTLNYEDPDPECQVDCVPNVARPLDVGIVLKNAFGFGGVNCCLVLGRPPDDDASA